MAPTPLNLTLLTMTLSELSALSPLDGRYRKKITPLAPFFSEFGLIRYRLMVEVEYLIALHDWEVAPLQPLEAEAKAALRSIYSVFSEEDAQAVKAIERRTNHDVKAVEYFLKTRIEGLGDERLARHREFVHFGLTSQDINNTATPLMLRDALQQVYLPQLDHLVEALATQADTWRNIPLLARTHGQPATPTTMGKEMAVFVARLRQQRRTLEACPFPAKFGGASGNLNAHYVAYPAVDWEAFAQAFVEQQLNLTRSAPTTQIEHYDGLAAIFDALKRINTILIDLAQDAWLYISQEYFTQKTKAGEVGSSAMPHKVNPIDFENAEGNLAMSSAMLEFLSRKLPVSRLQRDLTDSTVLRNLGVGIGHAYLAQKSLLKGLGKLKVNPAAMQHDLENNWAVLAEAIQTILRREQYPNPYEALRDLTRGNEHVTERLLKEFVDQLDVADRVKKELRALRPEAYLGNAPDFPNGR